MFLVSTGLDPEENESISVPHHSSVRELAAALPLSYCYKPLLATYATITYVHSTIVGMHKLRVLARLCVYKIAGDTPYG